MKRKFTTLKDIAKEAKVAPITVSRYINKNGYVGSNTVKKIKAAMSILGYYPSISARTMRKVKSSTIAIIVPSIKNDFYIGIIRRAEEVLRKNGYSVLIFDCNWSPKREKEFIQLSLSYRVDGIIGYIFKENEGIISKIVNENEIPLTIIENYKKNLKADFILFEDKRGAYLLIDHLIKVHDKKKIAAIFHPALKDIPNPRVEGLKEAFRNNGLRVNEDIIIFTDTNRKSGYDATKKLLKKDIDALFTSNTVLGAGAVGALQDMKVCYPEDISFVTYDDYDINTMFHPHLTSLKRVDADFGKSAAEAILSIINGKRNKNKIIKIKTALEIRESCGCQKTNKLGAL